MAGFSNRHITQRYIRQYGNTKRVQAWAGRLVNIRTENGVWRINGRGYTYPDKPDAWVLPFEDAQSQISHCGPEKQGSFMLIDQEPDVTI